MEQLTSQLGAATLELPTELLDKIDKIVLPGTNASQSEIAWDNPALHAEERRR
jgi:hypothetical protein